MGSGSRDSNQALCSQPLVVSVCCDVVVRKDSLLSFTVVIIKKKEVEVETSQFS